MNEIITSKDDDNMNENKFIENLIEYEEFYLLNDNKIYKFLIEKRKKEITIKCKNYEIKFNDNNLSILTKSSLKKLDEAYDFFINLFEQNRVTIKNIINNKTIRLLFQISSYNRKRDLEIILIYNKDNKYMIFNELNENYTNLKNNVNYLKNQINIIKKELDNLKTSNNISISKTFETQVTRVVEYNSDPDDIEFLTDITTDSYADFSFDNSFTVFKSINDILCLIYSNKNKSIICYDVVNSIKINEIKNAHATLITNFRHYFDQIKRMDLLLSISTMDNNIKLWNVKNFECFADIKNPNSDYWIFSTCFLSDNNETCIVTSNGNLGVCEYIEVFDIHGNKIKEINESNDDTYFIDTYKDNKTDKNYIITGNKGFVKSFAYNKNRIYNIYDDNDNKPHHSVIINNKDVFTKLIESSVDGNIRIWNFHSGELLNRIRAGNNYLNGICLWNNDYLFVACNDKVIKLIDLKRGIVLKDLIAHSDRVSTVKKVFHPHYGECLISQGKYNDQIKIWTHKI